MEADWAKLNVVSLLQPIYRITTQPTLSSGKDFMIASFLQMSVNNFVNSENNCMTQVILRIVNLLDNLFDK